VSVAPEELGPELAGTIAAVAQEYVGRLGGDAGSREQARRAYAYIDTRQFDQIWAAAVKFHSAQSRP